MAWLLDRILRHLVGTPAWGDERAASRAAQAEAAAVIADVHRLVERVCAAHEGEETGPRPFPIADFIRGTHDE